MFLADGNPGWHTRGCGFWDNWGKETGYTTVGFVDGHARLVTYTSLRDYLLKVWTSRVPQ